MVRAPASSSKLRASPRSWLVRCAWRAGAGTVLLFGISTMTEASLPSYQFYFKELTLVNARAAKSEDFPATIGRVARGALKLEALITHVLPLPELATALGLLDSDSDERMKVILEHRC